MINKLFPRVLNSSKDSRVRGAMEMKDAINVTVTSDYDLDFAGSNNAGLNDGDTGVIKPALGNSAASLKTFDIADVLAEGEDNTRRVIGKVEDSKAGVIYFFLFSNITTEMGVYAWDAYNYFGGGDGQWRPIYCTPEFNFSDTGRVVGDVVHVSGGAEVDFRPILYFTDDENEPRKLDVLRCLEQGYTPGNFEYAPNDINDKDFITACPRSPVIPPTFEFFDEEGANQRSSDFRKVPGVQFAYQCIYAGGEESALSTYSDIAIPEEYLRQGTISGEIDLPQLCRITIDPAPFGIRSISDEVVAFKILVRRGNDGPFYVVDEVDRNTFSGDNPTTYDFYNDRVLIGITESEENKQFDALPRLAQALSVVENRLFYGNYVEGYDEVPLEGTVTPVYLEGSTLSESYELQATPIVATYDKDAVSLAPVNGGTLPRSAGVAIDTSSLPESLALGTSISVSFSFNPGKNISIYNSDASFHGSLATGGRRGDTEYYTNTLAQTFSNSFTGNIDQEYATVFSEVDGVLTVQPNKGFAAVGSNAGVAPALEWVQTESHDDTSTVVTDAILGVSAAAPLKIKGGVVNFSIELLSTETIDSAQTSVADAIGVAMSGGVPEGFDIIQSNIIGTYNFNHQFRNPQADEEGRLFRLGKAGTTFNPELGIEVPTDSQSDALDCITPVFENQSTFKPAPIGYVIVNEAAVAMELVYQPHMTEDPLGRCILTLEVSALNNVDVMTCVPCMTIPDLRVRQWRVYDGDYLSANAILDVEDEFTGQDLASDFAFDGTFEQTTSAVFHELASGNVNDPSLGESWLSSGFAQRRKVVGYLRPSGSELTSVSGSDILTTNKQIRDELNLNVAQVLSTVNGVGVSMVDSEGGFEFQAPRVKVLDDAIGDIILLNYEGVDANEGAVSSQMILNGSVIFRPPFQGTNLIVSLLINGGAPFFSANENKYFQALLGPNFQNYLSGTGTNVQFGIVSTGGEGINDSEFLSAGMSTECISDLTPTDPNLPYQGALQLVMPETNDEQLQEVEVNFNGFLDQVTLSGAYRSFKTSAYHDLGVVYYDDRGRPGNVNQLPRVYVAGYANEERIEKGRVELQINLTSAPPPWAHQYQIVYAGNSTYQDFIQYSVGGAFVDERGDGDTARNIYISLNHLQSDKQVSYAEAFGAVDPNGNKDLYTFVPGDQVRVISYQNDPNQPLVFPNQLVFDVVDQVLLTGNGDAETEETRNPLDSGSDDTPLFLRGSFLKLRDNPEANGFNWTSVSTQGNDFGGTLSNWSSRCVVEILRPRAAADADIRAYQETGLVFNVGRLGPSPLVHQTPIIFMRNGDVWWRRVPLNLQDFDIPTGKYASLIPESETITLDGEDEEIDELDYQPRFRNRYLECKTFTDTFAGADVNGYGKRKFYSPEAAEVRRESSITYSDANDFSTRRVRFTSFNPFQAPFKDLPNQHGSINALVEFSEFLFVVQEDKASVVPINRNILADASGSDQLISSDKIIGKQKFIGGKYGADNNRESVVKVDESVYFAHKGNGEVYRFQGGKIEVIGRKGVAAQLYDAFQDVLLGGNGRVVSGYDPLKDEYIVSIINIDSIGYIPPNIFSQPSINNTLTFNLTGNPFAVNPNAPDGVAPGGEGDGVTDVFDDGDTSVDDDSNDDGTSVTGDVVRDILGEYETKLRNITNSPLNKTFPAPTTEEELAAEGNQTPGFRLAKRLSVNEGDINDDGLVGAGDLLRLLQEFGEISGPENPSFPPALDQSTYITDTDDIANKINDAE